MSIILVLGGARSGKSLFAENLVLRSGRQPVYVATALSHDEEMRERIRLHQDRRNTLWQTMEEPLDLVSTLERVNDETRCVLVDCLTLWLSNLMLEDKDIETEKAALLSFLTKVRGTIVFVANEVGLGIVPDNVLARQFRDGAGSLNQAVASVAHKVYFIAAGLPMLLKG